MNILYIGDIMGEPGIEALRRLLPRIIQEYAPDLIIAQAENTTDGRGISLKDFKRLQSLGIDFCTGGNWSLFQKDIFAYLSDTDKPIVRPANYPVGTPGKGWKYINTTFGPVLIISLLGQIVGRDADRPVDNPLQVIDSILENNRHVKRAATIVNFHGDFSSEKVVIGYYLDGKVSAVIGDHWHVPTADARVLPKGTAHITDVGMCGTLRSSLGIKIDTIISRWRDGTVNRNLLEEGGPLQFNAVLIDIDPKTGGAASIKQIQEIVEH